MLNKYQSIEAFDTHALFYIDYCKIKSIIKGQMAIFTLNISPEICNDNYIDYGVLMTMVDGLTSYSQIYISKLKLKKSLSINLNLKIFKQLEKNKEYEMSVKIYSESKQYTVFKCKIYDETGRTMCIASHVKRNLEAKF